MDPGATEAQRRPGTRGRRARKRSHGEQTVHPQRPPGPRRQPRLHHWDSEPQFPHLESGDHTPDSGVVVKTDAVATAAWQCPSIPRPPPASTGSQGNPAGPARCSVEPREWACERREGVVQVVHHGWPLRSLCPLACPQHSRSQVCLDLDPALPELSGSFWCQLEMVLGRELVVPFSAIVVELESANQGTITTVYLSRGVPAPPRISVPV